MTSKFRDLTAEELRYVDRDILAGRLAAIQQERAELIKKLADAKTVAITTDITEAAALAYEEETGGHLWREEAVVIARAVFESAGFAEATR
jgi:hypothetical protein